MESRKVKTDNFHPQHPFPQSPPGGGTFLWKPNRAALPASARAADQGWKTCPKRHWREAESGTQAPGGNLSVLSGTNILPFSGITERGFLPSAILGFSPARQIRENLVEGIERHESQEDTRCFVCLGFCLFFAFQSFCFDFPHFKLKALKPTGILGRRGGSKQHQPHSSFKITCSQKQCTNFRFLTAFH